MKKLIKYFHTQKTINNPVNKYMTSILTMDYLFLLLQSPELFLSNELYYKFVQQYFPSIAENPMLSNAFQLAIYNSLQRRTTNPQARQRLYNLNYERMLYEADNIQRDKNVSNTMDNMVRLHELIHSTTEELTEKQSAHLENIRNKFKEDFIKLRSWFQKKQDTTTHDTSNDKQDKKPKTENKDKQEPKSDKQPKPKPKPNTQPTPKDKTKDKPKDKTKDKDKPKDKTKDKDKTPKDKTPTPPPDKDKKPNKKKYDPKLDKEFMEKMNKINEYHKKRIENLNKKQDKDAENKIKITKERMKTKNAKKYKIWRQTPNPHTRHTITNGQKVPLNEKFTVINDKTGQIDYLDYPGDRTGSPANTINCLCNIEFTDDPTGLYNPDKNSVEQQYQTLQNNLKEIQEYLSQTGIKLTNDQTLKQEYNKNLEKFLKILKPSKNNRIKTSEINEKIIEEYDKKSYNKKEYPDEWSEDTIFAVNLFQKEYKDGILEYGMPINYKTGEPIKIYKGETNKVGYEIPLLKQMEYCMVVHNHPSHGLPMPSRGDIANLLGNDYVDFSVVVSKNQKWIIKNKNLNTENIGGILDTIKEVYDAYDIIINQNVEQYKKEVNNKNFTKYRRTIEIDKYRKHIHDTYINKELLHKYITGLTKYGVGTYFINE